MRSVVVIKAMHALIDYYHLLLVGDGLHSIVGMVVHHGQITELTKN